MFEKIINGIKKVVSRFMKVDDIKDILGRDIAIDEEGMARINNWKVMYEDNPAYKGKSDNQLEKTTNTPAMICSEFARLVTLELESEVLGKLNEDGEEIETDETIDKVKIAYQNVLDNIDHRVEYGCAVGGAVFKPYLNNEEIDVDYSYQGEFYPLSYNSKGDLLEAVFPDRLQEGDIIYTRLEIHELTELGIRITNLSYKGSVDDEGLGRPIPLHEIPGCEEMETEIIIQGIYKPLFGYFKTNIANNKNMQSPYGVSMFARAEQQIEDLDRHYNAIDWEYNSKETAIEVAEDYLKTIDTTGRTKYDKLDKREKRLYRLLEVDTENFNKMAINIYSPEIREESFYKRFNELKKEIEDKVGLARGTISDVEFESRTATEIMASKQRSYSTVRALQNNLEVALRDMIEAMMVYAALIDGKSVLEEKEYEVTFDFDDSLIVDEETEQKTMLLEVEAGLIKPEVYLMKRYGLESEEKAREIMPELLAQFDNLE